jgi:hypothetical protein
MQFITKIEEFFNIPVMQLKINLLVLQLRLYSYI